MYGRGEIDAVRKTVEFRNEVLTDARTLLHRNIIPVRIIEVESDDTTKINKLRKDWRTAVEKGDVIIIPKGTVVVTEGGLSQNQTLNPLPYLDSLNKNFYQAQGGTDILVGASLDITDGASKIKLLGMEATAKRLALELEEQILAQLNLEVKFPFLVTIQQDAISDTSQEEEPIREAVEPNDQVAELEGRK